MRIYNSTITGSLKIKGDIEAENYIVNTTVTALTQSFSSGSTIFGDSTDDTHQFTGSMGILHAGSNESQTGLLIKNSAGSGNSSARLLLQGNGGDNGTLGTIASRNTNASYDDVDYARIKFVIPGSSMTTHGIEFHTGDGGAATKKFEIHGNKISGSATSTGSFGHVKIPNGNIDIMTGNADTRVGIGKLHNNMFYVGANPSGSAASGGDVGVKIGTVDSGGNVRKHWTFTSAGNFQSTTQNLGSITMGGTTFKIDSTYNDVKIQMGYDTVPFVINKPIYNLADVEFIQDEKKNIKFFEDAQTGGEIMQLYRGGINVSGSGNISGSSTSTGSFGELEVGHIFPHSDGVSNIGGVGKQFADLYLKDNGNLRFGNANVYLNGTTDTLNLTGGNLVIAANFGLGLSGTAKVYHSSYVDYWYRSLFDSGHGGMAGFSSYVNVNSVYGAANRGWEFYDDNANVTRVGIDSLTGLIKTQGGVSGSSTSTGSFGLLQVDGGQGSGVSIGPLNTGNADDRKLTIVGYDEPMIEFETHAGWGRQRIQGHYGGVLKMWNSGSQQKELNIQVGHDTERQGDVRFYHSEYDTIQVGLNGAYPIAYFGAESGSTNYNGSAVISSRIGTGGINKLYFTDTNIISGSSSSTGSFGMLRVGDSGANLVLRTKSANISIGNMNTYPYVMNSGAGNYNIAIGTETMMSQTSGERNVGVGYQAGRSNVGGDYNTFMGFGAGRGTTSGTYAGNTGLGYNTLYTVNTGNNNTAVGRDALYYLDKGEKSVAVGNSAGYYATGSYNTFVGTDAGLGGTTSAPYSSGQHNTALGYQALKAFTTGNYNVAIGREALPASTSGGSSVAIGYAAGLSITTSNLNVLIGYQAGAQQTTADNNTAVGSYASQHNFKGTEVTTLGYRAGRYATGSYNTFVGSQAGLGGTTSAPYSSGGSNTAIGYAALDAFTTGHSNVAIGYQAGTDITTGHENTIVGYQAGENVTTADNNVIMGFQAGQNLTSARYNVLIGDGAGMNLTAANDNNENVFIGNSAGRMADNDEDGVNQGATDNVYIGSGAGYYLDDGAFNVIIGKEAGKSASGTQRNPIRNVIIGMEAAYDITTGDDNVIAGYQAGANITTGYDNTILGKGAATNMTTGYSNVSIAPASLNFNVTGYAAVAIGQNAGYSFGRGGGHTPIGSIFIGNTSGYYATGSYNVFVGYESGKGGTSGTPYSSGEHNIGMGYRSLYGFTTGDDNVAIGAYSGDAITSGTYNIAMGQYSLSSVTSGGSNIGIGRLAGSNNTTANSNMYIGYAAGYANQTGVYNTIVGNYSVAQSTGVVNFNGVTTLGFQAGYYATGSYNTFVGAYSGNGTSSAPHSSGTANTAVGYNTLINFTTGTQNTIIGSYAGDAITSGNYNTFVGSGAGGAITTGVQNTFVGRNVGTGADDANYNVAVGDTIMNANFGNTNIGIGYNVATSITGTGNIAIGNNVNIASNSRNYTIGIGVNALRNNNTAYIIAIGFQAGEENTSGDENTYLGYSAGWKNQTGQYVTAVGYEAGAYATGSSNTFIGNASGKGGNSSAPYSSGQLNTFIGKGAGKEFTTGGYNNALGAEALDALTTGVENSAMGVGALGSITTQNSNVAIGGYAGTSIAGSDAIDNVIIGNYAGTGGSGDLKRSIAIGKNALNSTGNADVIGAVAIGYDALTAANNGNIDYSVAIGASALGELQSGQQNVGIGYQALTATNGGQFNVAMGAEAGKFNVTGTGNIYMGYQAGRGLFSNSHSYNVGLGYQSLYDVTTGGSNVAIGKGSGTNITSGPRNVLLGTDAGDTITTGEQNILVGSSADVDSNAGSNRIGIGYNVSVDADHKTVIGASTQTKLFLGTTTGSMAVIGGKDEPSQPYAGTETPKSGLRISGHTQGGAAPSEPAQIVIHDYSSSTNGGRIKFERNRNDGVSYVQNNDVVGEIQFVASSSYDYDETFGCRIAAIADDTHTATKLDTALTFWTNADSNGRVEHFRIAHDGTLTATDTTIGSNSDVRLKENIVDFNGGLDIINKLKPKTFNFINQTEHMEGTRRGFIAQDIMEVDNYWINEHNIPEDNVDYPLVEDTDGTSYVSKLGEKDAMYVSAIQELTEIVKSQQKEIEELKKK